jgi:hypothetical protein
MAHLVADEAELADCRVLVNDDHSVAGRAVVDTVVLYYEHVVERRQVHAIRSSGIASPLDERASRARKDKLAHLARRVIHREPAEDLRVGQVERVHGHRAPVITDAAVTGTSEELLVIGPRSRFNRFVAVPAQDNCPLETPGSHNSSSWPRPSPATGILANDPSPRRYRSCAQAGSFLGRRLRREDEPASRRRRTAPPRTAGRTTPARRRSRGRAATAPCPRAASGRGTRRTPG